MDSQLMNYFKEAWNRIGSKSPQFFFVTKIIGASLALAGKLPWALDRYTNIEPSQQFITLCGDIGWFFAGVAGASFLPTSSKPVAVTKEGMVLKKTDLESLPFTAKSEETIAEKMEVQIINNLK